MRRKLEMRGKSSKDGEGMGQSGRQDEKTVSISLCIQRGDEVEIKNENVGRCSSAHQ